MLFTYIKKRSAKEIITMIETEIRRLQNMQETAGKNDGLFLRCQFKINALRDACDSINLKYRLNLKTHNK